MLCRLSYSLIGASCGGQILLCGESEQVNTKNHADGISCTEPAGIESTVGTGVTHVGG